MESTNTIIIQNPSVSLAAFIANVHRQKKENMKQLRQKFKKVL